MTPEERTLWVHLRAHRTRGLHFRRQQIISGYIVDFYCHAARLVIEIDGPVHDAQQEYDAWRDQVMTFNHVRVIRFTNHQIRHDFRAVLARIEEELGNA